MKARRGEAWRTLRLCASLYVCQCIWICACERVRVSLWTLTIVSLALRKVTAWRSPTVGTVAATETQLMLDCRRAPIVPVCMALTCECRRVVMGEWRGYSESSCSAVRMVAW